MSASDKPASDRAPASGSANRRVTTIDIARAAGVSKMTVSRALRGERGISQATRQHIQAIAEKLGYRPDPAVSELMGHLRKSRTAGFETLAWMTTYDTIGGWRDNPGTCDIFRGATAQAHRLGYRLEEFSLRTSGMTPKRLGNILYNQGIRGIVLAPLLEHGSIEGFPWQHFATACCSHSLLSPLLHRVSVDHFEVFRVAWQNLVTRGYERIGLCVSETDDTRLAHRWQGALLVENRALPANRGVEPMISDDWNAAAFLRWYRLHKPDVVLSHFPEVLDWMKHAGIRVPRDCGFALLRLWHTKGIAGVDHRFPDIGAATVSLVAGELNTNQYGIPTVRKSVSIECVWQGGPTAPGRS
ncbi:transcriptional regulator [Opitutaceae bacterium TAV1]|nr:transcriptional regulator [Opitutaceae bacterium TAV1]